MINYRHIILFLIGLIIFIHLTNSIISMMLKEGGGTLLTTATAVKKESADKTGGDIKPKFKTTP